MFRVNRLRRDEKGQAIVEFALVFLMIVILALGIAQFSMIFSAQIAVTNAAREGARAAAVGTTEANVRTIVTNSIGKHDFLNKDSLLVSVTGNTIGELVEVKVTGTYVETIVPVPSFNGFRPGAANIIDLGTQFPISGEASMRLETN